MKKRHEKVCMQQNKRTKATEFFKIVWINGSPVKLVRETREMAIDAARKIRLPISNASIKKHIKMIVRQENPFRPSKLQNMSYERQLLHYKQTINEKTLRRASTFDCTER